MDKNKFTDKLKQGVSVHELESFARKHTTELLTAIAIITAAISSAYDFFTSARMAVLFIALGCILAIIFPAPMERSLKKLYGFTFKQEKTTELIMGAFMIIIAIFVPFVLFGILGLLAGTSYHYYIRNAQIMGEHKTTPPHYHHSGEEHD